MPACAPTHDVKYAHHGPTPERAVAVRYSAMRALSLEPGGSSATPSSRSASATRAAPCGEGGGTTLGGAELGTDATAGAGTPAGAPTAPVSELSGTRA